MSTTVKRGYNGKMYINTGTHGSPVLVEVANLTDAKVSAAFDKTEATTRQGGGTKQSHPTLFDPGFSAKIRSDDSDTTGYIYLETAFYGRSIVDVILLDGASSVNGSRGVRFDANVFKWDESQGNDEVMFRDFELSPGVTANPAMNVIVASGAPVYTTVGP